ncbi:PQQ-binding-like beta-propeller repeat protein [Zhongshania sp.]|jgi:outer membrane protein assembly factor BamB|uniref:outer membrane protein assembly factor BamB family protein n=1 Tax=Zhongshania sp. TaxID=1971902 RepID=UPI0039E33F10
MKSKVKKILGLAVLLLVTFFAVKAYLDNNRPHNPKVFGPPEKTQWKPVGARAAGQHGYDVIPEPDTFNAIHVDVANSDSVWGVAAPMFELDWVAEPAYFVGNGPLFDNAGNLYLSPQFYHGERVVLVSLDAQTGKRRWAIPADNDIQASSPAFILNDPENPGSQIIYIVGYNRVMALRPDGSTVWSKATGLSLPPSKDGKKTIVKFHSFNYHPATDSLISITKDGALFAFSRKSGELIAAIGQVPGAPAISGNGTNIPTFVLKKVDPLMDKAFGKTDDGLSLFSAAVSYIYGGGGVVTNFFSIDPDSSRIFMAATAEDKEDGTEDGRSEIGAIYALDLVDDGNGGLMFQILNRKTFHGGTGSTPALSADGQRLYVSDNAGNVIALDSELNEVWRVDVGEPLVGSISVAPDNHELYAVTSSDVIKLFDNGDSGSVSWKGELNGFDGYANVDVQSNALTATVTANGVVVMIGGGKTLLGRTLMLHMGMGLLDRETGKLRYFAEGREDSLAMSVVAADGSIYVAHSPLRRAVGKAMYPELTQDVIGGIARFKPIRLDLLARDAICAAEARAANASTLNKTTELAAINTDIRQIKVLMKQAGNAITKAVKDGDIIAEKASALNNLLEKTAPNLSPANLPQATPDLAAACTQFD